MPLQRFRLNLIGRFFIVLFLSVYVGATLLYHPDTAFAAANMAASAPASVNVGDTVNVAITINTGGQSANAFEGNITYPSDLFDGVRGTYSGSICTLPITQPDPSGGSASFSCGRPSGFNGSGTVVTIVLTAKSAGSGSFGLNGCRVLANDGQGTNITGSCSGKSVTVSGSQPAASTPTPVAATPTPNQGGGSATPTPVAQQSNGSTTTKTATPKPTASPKTSPTPTPVAATPTPDTRAGVAAEQANTAAPPGEPGAPPVQELAPGATPSSESEEQSGPLAAAENGRRTVSQAMKNVFQSFRDIPKLAGNLTGVIALLIALIPFLALVFAILLLAYRLYLLERRRRRTLDRLFEMELSELAALEGKLDLLAGKGTKGREQYREEFKKAKENILRQLKPDYAKPVEAALKPAAAPSSETAKDDAKEAKK